MNVPLPKGVADFQAALLKKRGVRCSDDTIRRLRDRAGLAPADRAEHIRLVMRMLDARRLGRRP